MRTDAPRRLTLLYQLYLTSQASRSLVRQALAGKGVSGEEYAIYSYLFANGPRTLSQGARDLAMPVTTLAGLLASLIERGDIERRPHPADRRARLLALTDRGRGRLEAAMPAFTAAYRALLAQLEADGIEQEDLYAALGQLRAAIQATAEELGERASAAAPA